MRPESIKRQPRPSKQFYLKLYFHSEAIKMKAVTQFSLVFICAFSVSLRNLHRIFNSLLYFQTIWLTYNGINEIHDECQSEAQVIRKKWYIEYVKDCMADSSFQPIINQSNLSTCEDEMNLSQYDRCLLENRIHRESMISTLNCYYRKDRTEDISLIRMSKLEALNTRNSTPEVYAVLMNCKANMADDVISLRNCLSQNANVIFIAKYESIRVSEHEVSDTCSSEISKVDLESFLNSNKFHVNMVPYFKCVQESLSVINDGCLNIANFLELYGYKHKELVTKCFAEGAGADKFDFMLFWECFYN